MLVVLVARATPATPATREVLVRGAAVETAVLIIIAPVAVLTVALLEAVGQVLDPELRATPETPLLVRLFAFLFPEETAELGATVELKGLPEITELTA